VRTRRLGRTILIFIPLIICAARLHAGKVGNPSSVTQEVARCLNMVRIAATRRGDGHGGATRPARRPGAASADPTP
jgi:hypothetical protein